MPFPCQRCREQPPIKAADGSFVAGGGGGKWKDFCQSSTCTKPLLMPTATCFSSAKSVLSFLPPVIQADHITASHSTVHPYTAGCNIMQLQVQVIRPRLEGEVQRGRLFRFLLIILRASNGKENGSYYIAVILGLYWDNGKENGDYYIGVNRMQVVRASLAMQSVLALVLASRNSDCRVTSH